MKKYLVLCLLTSSLYAMEQEELSFFLNLHKENAAKMKEEAAKENKFAEIMQKSRENSSDLTSDDYEFLSAYEKERSAVREKKDKEERDRPVIALERIANAYEMQTKIELIKLNIQLMGPNRSNELEHNLGYDNSQTADYTFNHFVKVVENLGKTKTESKANEQTQDSKDSFRDIWIKGGISL